MPPDSPQNEEIVLRVESRELFSDWNLFWCICDCGQSLFSNIKSTDIKSCSPKRLPGSQLGKTFSFPPLQRPVMLTRLDLVQLWITWHMHVYNVMKMPRLHPFLSTFISATGKLLCIFSWIWSVNRGPTVFFICHRVKQPWMSFLNLFVKLVSGFNLKEAVKQLPSSCRWTCTGWFCFCGLCGIKNLIRWSAVVEGFSFFTTLLNQKNPHVVLHTWHNEQTTCDCCNSCNTWMSCRHFLKVADWKSPAGKLGRSSELPGTSYSPLTKPLHQQRQGSACIQLTKSVFRR